MIGKQTKGTSFSGCVCYVLREDKSKLLEAVGVEGTPEQMAEQFELQTLLNDKVKNTVGHTSLNFSPKDGERLRHDDTLMLQIAHDYMAKMGIADTQYIVARHTDREHSHCHIVFNRVDNDGRTISDKNDFYKALKEELPNARNWEELKDALSDKDIELKFKVSWTTREMQGVKFEYGGISFSGSKVSREFSYMNIDYQLGRNAFEDDFNNKQATIRQPREETVQTVSQKHSEDSSGSRLGLFCGIGSSFDVADVEANQEMAEILRKKKKAKRKRGMRL